METPEYMGRATCMQIIGPPYVHDWHVKHANIFLAILSSRVHKRVYIKSEYISSMAARDLSDFEQNAIVVHIFAGVSLT